MQPILAIPDAIEAGPESCAVSSRDMGVAGRSPRHLGDAPGLQSKADPFFITGPATVTVEEAIALLGLKITPEQFIAIFRIEGPALISFSGGRTSALMLWCILVAWGGALPAVVVVAFANTGKEREETLRFVHECGSRWGVKVHWLEYRDTEAGFEEVGFNSAGRSGEPFAALIAKRGFVPNGVTRFCTTVLKIRTMAKFARSLGWERWNNPVGLRFDEGHRVLKQQARNATGLERFTAQMPLAEARVTVREVTAFWAAQSFDLGLRSYEGNCDLCFLKSRGKLAQIMRDHPGMADWWIAQEALASKTAKSPAARQFLKDEAYADLARSVSDQPLLDFTGAGDDYDAECGDMCGGDGPAEIAALQREFERTVAAKTEAA